MNTKWLDSREHLLLYAGRKNTANEVTSLEAGCLSLVMVTKPKNVGTKAEFEKLDYFEQECWKLEVKSYNDVKMKTKNNLSSVSSVIWGQLTKGFQNRIIADSGFAFTKQSKDALRMRSLVDKTCNMTSKIDHYPTQLCESTCMLQELRGKKLSLSNYYDHFKQCIESTELVRFAMDSALHRLALLNRK